MALIYKPLDTINTFVRDDKMEVDKNMPRSRRRHHSRSRSRSRSRSHSHDRDRDVKRRKIEAVDSPHSHKRSLSSEPEIDKKEVLLVEDKPIVDLETSQNEMKAVAPSEPNKNEKKCAVETESNAAPSNKTTDKSTKSEDVKAKMDEGKTPEPTDEEETTETTNIEEHADKEKTEGEEIDADTSVNTVDLTLNDSSGSMGESSSKTSKQVVTPNKSLNPVQLKKRLESEKKREAKRREREEREKQKQEDRERIKQEKLKQKHEKDEKREKERLEKQKEKELKDEQKRKEKEEKEQKRKEKEEREEQKRKEKEQERLKKQQEVEEKNREKQKLEEQKQKTAAAFVNFFVPKKSDAEEKKSEVNQNSLFKDFEVKSDMRLPPKRRLSLTTDERESLVECVENQNKDCSYLKDLKTKLIGKCGKTWTYEDPLDEVIIVEDDKGLGETICDEDKTTKGIKLKAKFLKFHENRRPPYFGTWRKKTTCVKPRRPFAQDADILNYEEDSDDDWEEEEQGESLDDSDGEDKETEATNDDYEVDNDFFVPHGHLSDDEVDDEATSKLSPESHKQKLKLLKDEFDLDIKSKTNKIKPRFIGCIWYNSDSKNVDEAIDQYLKPLSIITNRVVVIQKRRDVSSVIQKKTDLQLKELDPSLIPDFIKFVHGNVNNRKLVVTEFLNYVNKKGQTMSISKASLSRKVKQIADWMKCPENGPMYNKLCWYVPEDIRKKYNLDLSLPNSCEMTTKN